MRRPWGRGPSTTVVTDEAVDDTALRDARDAVLATGDWRPAFVHPWYHSRSGAEKAFRRAVRLSGLLARLDGTS